MEKNLHQKNAAEWAMYVALLPFVPVAWLVDRLSRRKWGGR